MIRIGTAQFSSFGPKLRRDVWWNLTVAGLATYINLQAAALVGFVSLWLGRRRGECLLGPECDWLAGWSNSAVGVVVVLGSIVSIGILYLLLRLMRALWRRRFWSAFILRAVGWVTAAGGLVFILAQGWPWLVVGLWIALTSRRMEADFDLGSGPAQATGEGSAGGPAYDIPIDGDVIDAEEVEIRYEDRP